MVAIGCRNYPQNQELQANKLDLTFRMINNADSRSTLKFFDVEHKIISFYGYGVFTKNFKKPIATNRLFLNGQSYHPPHVFKSIVSLVAIRMRYRYCTVRVVVTWLFRSS